MIGSYFTETLSVYCGGIDNLYRHHDYTLAILESIRPYAMAKYWLHAGHLKVFGKKMSKSKGNIIYTDMLREKGFSFEEIRFFLIYGRYREEADYTDSSMAETAELLRRFRKKVRSIETGKRAVSCREEKDLREAFTLNMDNDLDLRSAFDGMNVIISGIEPDRLSRVLNVIF
jgi:cysteinyl-tRNA synthetase